MSALYGRLTGDRAKTQATRLGEQSIHVAVETANGVLVAALERDGTFRVSARPKRSGPMEAVLLGRGMLPVPESNDAPCGAWYPMPECTRGEGIWLPR